MEYPVIISGGGIIGCYIHLRLKQAGISSQIIEKGLPTSGSVTNIRTISLNPSSYKLLLEIGIEPYLASIISEIIATTCYMISVTVFLRKTKTF